MSVDIVGFPGRLRRLREAAGIGSRDLSRRLQKNSGYIALIESGGRWRNRLPAHDILVVLARELRVSLNELIGLEGLPLSPGETTALTEGFGAAWSSPSAAVAVAERDELLQTRSALQQARYQIWTLETELARAHGHRVIAVLNYQDVYVAAPESACRERISVDAALWPLETLPHLGACYAIDAAFAAWGVARGDYLLLDRQARDPRPGQRIVVRIDGRLRPGTVIADPAGGYCFSCPSDSDEEVRMRRGASDAVLGTLVGLLGADRRNVEVREHHAADDGSGLLEPLASPASADRELAT